MINTKRIKTELINIVGVLRFSSEPELCKNLQCYVASFCEPRMMMMMTIIKVLIANLEFSMHLQLHMIKKNKNLTKRLMQLLKFMTRLKTITKKKWFKVLFKNRYALRLFDMKR